MIIAWPSSFDTLFARFRVFKLLCFSISVVDSPVSLLGEFLYFSMLLVPVCRVVIIVSRSCTLKLFVFCLVYFM